MSETRNTQVVKDAFAAFVRGDIAAIIDVLDDNVMWRGVIGTEGVLPQAGLRKGRAAVAQFFEQVDATLTFEQFDPREYVAQGESVVAIGRYRARTKPGGALVDSDFVMLFTIRDGRITGFREFADSAQIVRAYSAVAVA